MNKYIEAEELKTFMRMMLTGNDLYTPNGIDEFVDRLPAADVQEVVKEWCDERNCIIVAREDFPRLEVRHGRWIEAGDMPRLDNTFSIRCSLCGQLMLAHPNDENPNFCCNCGAKMDEVDNET